MISGTLRMFFKTAFILFCIQSLSHDSLAQSSYNAIITNLNTREEALLEQGKNYFFEIKNVKGLQSGKLSKVSADSLYFDGKAFSLLQITALSDSRFKKREGLHKTAKIAGFIGGITFLTGILMSASADDWQPIEQSYFTKASFISIPLIVPSLLFLKLHKGPRYDLLHQHLLETKKVE